LNNFYLGEREGRRGKGIRDLLINGMYILKNEEEI
jgi:hypothetical protein